MLKAGFNFNRAADRFAQRESQKPTTVLIDVLRTNADHKFKPPGPGYITVWPCGSPMPNASTLNFADGTTIANIVLTQLGAQGSVCVFTTTATHLIVDVSGYTAR